MRIGIFDPYLDDLGGGEKYMMTIAVYLAKKHKVDVFWDHENDLKALQERFNLDFSKVNLVPNIFKYSNSILFKLKETKKYDVIIFLSDGSIPIVLAKKLLLHIQQPLHEMQKGSVLENLKLRRVNAFFTNSEYTKSFIDKKFSLKTKVLYPPVEIFPQKVKKENIILHVGRFRVKNVKNGDFKKQSVMLEAFKEMINEGLNDWKLVFAVSVQDLDKKAFEEMKNNAKNYPIEFLINLPNNKLWDIYSKAKIYWHASGFGEDLEKNPEFAEHFGISTVEAMGAGEVPVVINAGGQKEIVTDGVNGYLWDSIKQLKNKTLDLILNSNKLEAFSKKAIDTSQKFDIEKFYKGIDNLIS